MTPPMPEPKVKRLFEHSVEPKHLEVDIAIVACIDPRWWNPTGQNAHATIPTFMKNKRWTFVPITAAGGIRVLASDDPKDAEAKESLFRRIEEEIVIHKPKALGFSTHSDCGGYGYLEAFGNDVEKERKRFEEDLWKAKATLGARFAGKHEPLLKGLLFFILDLDGVQEVTF